MDEALALEGLKAVDRFIESFNSRDPATFSAALQFPHIRAAHFGVPQVIPDAETHTANHSYQGAMEMGWDHSEWDYKHPIHTSEDKIHVAGQWTRYDVEGGQILTTPVTYIVTQIEGRWGIQARFAADFPGDADADTTDLQRRSFKVVESFIQGYNHANLESCAELLNYPHFQIDPGSVATINSADEFTLEAGVQLEAVSMVALQTGSFTTNIAVEVKSKDQENRILNHEGVILITERDGHLGIQAWSMITTDQEL